MVQHIAIDCGRDSTKTITRHNLLNILIRKDFKSRVGEWRELKLESEEHYQVNIDGSKFFIHDLAEESFFERAMTVREKIHDELRILFLSALGMVVNNGEKLIITTGLPIGQHTIETKNRFQELVKGKHIIQIDDKPSVECYIDNLNIIAESTSIFWNCMLDDQGIPIQSPFPNQTVRILDLGSREFNFSTIKFYPNEQRRKFLDKESGSLNYGMIELEKSGENPTSEMKNQFTRKIVGDVSKKWFTYEPLKDIIIIAGGGILQLQEYFKPHFPLLRIDPDPIFAPVKGMYKMGMAKWRKEQQVAR